MTTVLTPHSANQSASRQRSSVNVRNVRTNSLSRLGPTAATWIVAPISIAAAAGLTVEKSRDLRDRFVWLMSDALLKKSRGWATEKDQFPNRDRPQASPLASPQQPMGHVFLRGQIHQKSFGRSPPGQD